MSGIALLLQVLPFAIGAAISPAVLTVQILVLSSGPGALARGWALALGRMVALLVVAFGGAALLAQLPDVATGLPSTFEGGLLLAAGVVLLLLAWIELRKPPEPADRSKGRTARLAARLVDGSLVFQFAFGVVWMFVNASTLALYIPGLHVITSADDALPVKIAAFLLLFFAASAVALVPTLAVQWKGEAAQPVLRRIHEWVDARSRTITVAVCLLFGVGCLAYSADVLLTL